MEIKTWVKNPLSVEASRYNGTPLNAQELVEWMGEDNARYLEKEHSLEIVTLEGVMTVDEGDFVIKGIKGEFYPCKPHVFSESYSMEDEVPKIEEPTKPGFYVYSGGDQSMVFIRKRPGYIREDNAWAVVMDNGNFTTCTWGYIEQALGVWDLVRLEEMAERARG